GGAGRVGAGGRAAGRSDAHAPGRDLGAQSGGTGDGGRQPGSTNDRGRRPAGLVAGRRPHPARAGRSHAGDRDPTPDERREPRDSRGAEAGGGHLGRTRHGRGHRRGPEPMMTNGGGGGIRIAASVLSADLTRLAEQVEQVLGGGGGAAGVQGEVMEGGLVPNLPLGDTIIPPRGGPPGNPHSVQR